MLIKAFVSLMKEKQTAMLPLVIRDATLVTVSD
jgi:hypothetical protein